MISRKKFLGILSTGTTIAILASALYLGPPALCASYRSPIPKPTQQEISTTLDNPINNAVQSIKEVIPRSFPEMEVFHNREVLKNGSIELNYVHENGYGIQMIVTARMHGEECLHLLHEPHMVMDNIRLLAIGTNSNHKKYDFSVKYHASLDDTIEAAREGVTKLKPRK